MKRTRISAYVGRAAVWLGLLVLTACRPQALQDGKSVLVMIRATGVSPAQFTGNPWVGAGIGSMMVFAAEGFYQFSRMTDEISPRLAKRI